MYKIVAWLVSHRCQHHTNTVEYSTCSQQEIQTLINFHNLSSVNISKHWKFIGILSRYHLKARVWLSSSCNILIFDCSVVITRFSLGWPTIEFTVQIGLLCRSLGSRRNTCEQHVTTFDIRDLTVSNINKFVDNVTITLSVSSHIHISPAWPETDSLVMIAIFYTVECSDYFCLEKPEV